MKALIPVAGIGTRLQPLTNKIPKVLLNIAGKPMLFHLIDELIRSEKIDTIILVIGYLGENIKDAVNSHYVSSLPLAPSVSRNNLVKFEYVEQKEMLGLGHAVYQGNGLVGEEELLIVLGDTIFEFDLDRMLSSKYSANGFKDVEDISRFGIIESENGFITRMIEKPAPGSTNSKSAIAGVYFIKSGEKLFKAIEYLMENNIRTKNEFQLTDALQKLVDDGEKMIPFEIQNWFDCGKPETLISTNSYLLKRNYSNLSPSASVGDNKYQISNSNKITNPVFIGENCQVGSSNIGPNVTIAEGAVVRNSKITNSIIFEGAHVIDAELEDALIGSGEIITGQHKNVVKADSVSVSF